MDFDLAITRVLGHEGRYSNDPDDPGGETNWGISKKSYPHLDIKNLTREEAVKIYRRDFWDKLGADFKPKPVVYQLLDFAVNSGIRAAIRGYQRALKVPDDGYFGPRSEMAAKTMSVTDQIMRVIAERIEYMTNAPNWKFHGKGWANRIALNLRYGAEDS
jgi:lysozyme family protein